MESGNQLSLLLITLTLTKQRQRVTDHPDFIIYIYITVNYDGISSQELKDALSIIDAFPIGDLIALPEKVEVRWLRPSDESLLERVVAGV